MSLVQLHPFGVYQEALLPCTHIRIRGSTIEQRLLGTLTATYLRLGVAACLLLCSRCSAVDFPQSGACKQEGFLRQLTGYT